MIRPGARLSGYGPARNRRAIFLPFPILLYRSVRRACLRFEAFIEEDPMRLAIFFLFLYLGLFLSVYVFGGPR